MIRYIAACLVAWACAPAWADDATELAKKTQNPVSDLISVPFQSNFNFNVGPKDEMQYVLNIQPVAPLNLGDHWMLINRPILPVIYQPTLAPGVGDEWGLGDLTYQAYLSPRGEGEFIWGAGVALVFPTNTDDIFGSDKWSAGPGFVGLWMHGPWVIGGLVNNVWSYAGPSGEPDVNFMTLQPIANYNFGQGWYLASAPIITADWEADSDERWTVPIGGGLGKIMRWGKLPVNGQVQAFWNAEHPSHAANWQLRVQIQLLFPK
jgi:hypothetical protein